MSILKGYVNKHNNSSRIYSAEDIENMSTTEFSNHEKAIDYQMQSVGAPTNENLKKSDDVVFVKEYTRTDGVHVKAHYRSKPDKNGISSNLPIVAERNPSEDYDTDMESSKILGAIIKYLQTGEIDFPETQHPNEEDPRRLPDETPDEKKDPEEEEKRKNYENFFKNIWMYVITGEFNKEKFIEDFVRMSANTKDFNIPDEDKEHREKILKYFKDKNEQLQNVVNMVTNFLPADSEFSAGIKNLFELKKQVDENLVNSFDPEKIKEKEIQKATQWLNDFTDFSAQLVRGDFEYIKWDEIGEKLHISEIASAINPVAGIITTLAVDIAPKIIKLVEATKTGDKQEIIKQAMGAFKNCLSVVGPLKSLLDEKFGGLEVDVDKEVYGEIIGARNKLETLQDAGYRYEKLVEAGLYEDAEEQIERLKEASQKLLDGEATGFASGLQENIEEVQNYNDLNPLHTKADALKNLSKMSNEIVLENKIGENIDGWSVKEVIYNEKTNFKAVVFEKENEIVASFVGTDFKNPKDNFANAQMFLTSSNKQMEEARDICEELKNKYGDKSITIIGHSEGGSEAIYSGAYNGLPVITYNAYGVSKKALPKDFSADKIYNYSTSNDIVSKLRSAPGNNYVLPSEQSFIKANTPLGWADDHRMENIGNLNNSIPKNQYGQQFIFNFLKNSDLQKINNQNIQNTILQNIKKNKIFERNLSERELWELYNLYYMYF